MIDIVICSHAQESRESTDKKLVAERERTKRRRGAYLSAQHETDEQRRAAIHKLNAADHLVGRHDDRRRHAEERKHRDGFDPLPYFRVRELERIWRDWYALDDPDKWQLPEDDAGEGDVVIALHHVYVRAIARCGNPQNEDARGRRAK